MIGQTRIEFIVGILIFSVILIFIVSQTNITFSNLLTDSRTDLLKAKAVNVITILSEDRGDPSNWDLNPENVKRVGLAQEPYILSASKINELNSNCSLIENFDLGSFRIKVYNSTHRMLLCGYDILNPPQTIEVRYVKIGNEYGNISVEMW